MSDSEWTTVRDERAVKWERRQKALKQKEIDERRAQLAQFHNTFEEDEDTLEASSIPGQLYKDPSERRRRADYQRQKRQERINFVQKPLSEVTEYRPPSHSSDLENLSSTKSVAISSSAFSTLHHSDSESDDDLDSAQAELGIQEGENVPAKKVKQRSRKKKSERYTLKKSCQAFSEDSRTLLRDAVAAAREQYPGMPLPQFQRVAEILSLRYWGEERTVVVKESRIWESSIPSRYLTADCRTSLQSALHTLLADTPHKTWPLLARFCLRQLRASNTQEWSLRVLLQQLVAGFPSLAVGASNSGEAEGVGEWLLGTLMSEEVGTATSNKQMEERARLLRWVWEQIRTHCRDRVAVLKCFVVLANPLLEGQSTGSSALLPGRKFASWERSLLAELFDDLAAVVQTEVSKGKGSSEHGSVSLDGNQLVAVYERTSSLEKYRTVLCKAVLAVVKDAPLQMAETCTRPLAALLERLAEDTAGDSTAKLGLSLHIERLLVEFAAHAPDVVFVDNLAQMLTQKGSIRSAVCVLRALAKKEHGSKVKTIPGAVLRKFVTDSLSTLTEKLETLQGDSKSKSKSKLPKTVVVDAITALEELRSGHKRSSGSLGGGSSIVATIFGFLAVVPVAVAGGLFYACQDCESSMNVCHVFAHCNE